MDGGNFNMEEGKVSLDHCNKTSVALSLNFHVVWLKVSAVRFSELQTSRFTPS